MMLFGRYLLRFQPIADIGEPEINGCIASGSSHSTRQKNLVSTPVTHWVLQEAGNQLWAVCYAVPVRSSRQIHLYSLARSGYTSSSAVLSVP